MAQHNRTVNDSLAAIDNFLGRFEHQRMMWTIPAPRDHNIHSLRCFQVSDPAMKRQPTQWLLFMVYKTGGWDVLIDAAQSNKIDDTFNAVMNVE